MKLTKQRFIQINSIIVLAFVAEHLFSNSVLPRFFQSPQQDGIMLIASFLTIVIWIIAVVVWWRFLKNNHRFWNGNIFPQMMLIVLVCIIVADAIMIGFHLVPSVNYCSPIVSSSQQISQDQAMEILDHYNATGECLGAITTMEYSFGLEAPFYVIIALIAGISYVVGRRKKKVQDMTKEELFQ